jgi:hypothetical protein
LSLSNILLVMKEDDLPTPYDIAYEAAGNPEKRE